MHGRIAEEVARLANSDSVAVRTRARKGLSLLSNERQPFPKGWVKSERLSGRL